MDTSHIVGGQKGHPRPCTQQHSPDPVASGLGGQWGREDAHMRSAEAASAHAPGGVTLTPTAQHPWVSIRIPHCPHRRVVVPTRPLSRASVSPVRSPEQGWTPWPAVGSQAPEQPLAPSLHTEAQAPPCAQPSGMCQITPRCARRPARPPCAPTGMAAGLQGPPSPTPWDRAPQQAEPWGPALSCPWASWHRGPAAPWQRGGQDSSGCQGAAGGATRTGRPCPHPTEAPQTGHGGVARGPAPHPRPRCQAGAAERKGAVRWNLGAGGDGAAGGGRARHVAAYVRRVQGRTARQPGHRGHRQGDTEPPPRTRAGHAGVGLPTAQLGTARPCRHGTCVWAQGTWARLCWSGGTGPQQPPRSPHITAGCPWVSPCHAAPIAALPARGDKQLQRELRHPRAWIQLRHRFFIHCGRVELELALAWQGGPSPHPHAHSQDTPGTVPGLETLQPWCSPRMSPCPACATITVGSRDGEQREKDACPHHHRVTRDPHAARRFLPDTVTVCPATVCRGAASLPEAGTG